MAIAKHKAAEHAYRTFRRVTERQVLDTLKGAEEDRKDFKVVKTPLKEYEVRYEKDPSGWYHFYVFDGERCIAILDTEPVNIKEYKSLIVPGVTPVMPHIILHKAYRKMGIASRIYLAVISGKFVFVTDSHTNNAKALWDRLAKVKGVRSMYAYEYEDQPLPENAPRKLLRRASRLLGQSKYFVNAS